MKKLILLLSMFTFFCEAQISVVDTVIIKNIPVKVTEMDTIKAKVTGTITVNPHGIISLPSNTTNLATNAIQTQINTKLGTISGATNELFLIPDILDLLNGRPNSYACSFSVQPTPGCTDLFTIARSTGNLSVRAIYLQGFATTNDKYPGNFIIRVGANTGGVTFTGTNVSMNRGMIPASTTTITVYTTNANILGSTLNGGSIRNLLIPFNLSIDPENNSMMVDFCQKYMHPLSLNNASWLCFNLNNATIPSGILYVTIYFDEG